ncbi:MAG: hypothetical protein FK733_11745 [Asgard group archaeon]|nr:hypothetical protein [Asgard group archaeon]
MIDDTKYCPFCGINLDQESIYCHNCGASLKKKLNESTSSVRIISERPLSDFPDINIKNLRAQYPTTGSGYAVNTNQSTILKHPTTTTHKYPRRKKQDETQGVISFIFAILAFTGVLPFIGSIVAIILGGKHTGPLGRVGRILGWVSLILICVFGVFLFL